MNQREQLLFEFQHESALTRSVLELVPDTLLDYQAEDSLHTMRWNVGHLADIPSWAEVTLMHDSFDVAPVDGPPHTTPEPESMAEALALFDTNVGLATTALEQFDLDGLDTPWSLLAGGQALMTHPRWFAYRTYLVTHVAHHRAHVLVYLRLNGIKTPAIYGG